MRCPYDGTQSRMSAPIYSLKEKPWDTINLHYDAGEWAVQLTEDVGMQVRGSSRRNLLAAVREALRLAKESV